MYFRSSTSVGPVLAVTAGLDSFFNTEGAEFTDDTEKELTGAWILDAGARMGGGVEKA